jgi:molybdopterin converting factor small subunit
MVTVEFYGVPRLRAGVGRLEVEGTTVGEALRGLAQACPTLDGTVLRDATVHPAYRLSLNGERFITDPATRLDDGDALILVAADVGG